MLLGEKIYKLRKVNGLSQENLAIKLNVSRQAVSKWETGVIPDINNVVKIANFFDCSLDYLLNDSVDSIEEINHSNKSDFKEKRSKYILSENAIFNLMGSIPSILLLITIILSKFIDFPIGHQDSKTGRYYTGFLGFIDYFRLEGFVYFCIILCFTSIILKTISKIYLESKKKDVLFDKKYILIYTVRSLLFIFGLTLFFYGIFYPWKFVWTIQSILVLSIYFIAIVSLSIYIKYH